MREIKIYQGGHPFKADNLTHMQSGFKEAIKALSQGIDIGGRFTLNGAQIATVGPNTTITAGYVVLDGEIYQVKPQSITTVGGTLYFVIKQYALIPDVPNLVVEAPSPSQNVNPNYGQLYQDSTRKDVHIERRAEIKFNAVTGDSVTGVIYTTASVLPLKQMRDALDRAAYKNEENLFTKTQSFARGTLDTLDMTIGGETHKHLRLKNDGNFFVYNPVSNFTISRINLVNSVTPTQSSPNIANNNGTEIKIHVINNSVRLLDYSLHTNGTYSTGGGILIPESMGSKEILIPDGGTITLVRSNDYTSAYEYILTGINSDGYAMTSAGSVGDYTQIAEIELNTANETKFSLIEIASTNGMRAKLFFQLSTGVSFATNATGLCEIQESNGLTTDNFAFRLETKNVTQQIAKVYLRMPTGGPWQFRIKKILNSGLINKSPQIMSYRPISATLAAPLVSYIVNFNNYYNTALVTPTDVRRQGMIEVVQRTSPSVPGKLEYELALAPAALKSFHSFVTEGSGTNISAGGQYLVSPGFTPNDGIIRKYIFSCSVNCWHNSGASAMIGALFMRFQLDPAFGGTIFEVEISAAAVLGTGPAEGKVLSGSYSQSLPPNTRYWYKIYNSPQSGKILGFNLLYGNALGFFDSYV